ncbi:transglutaminase-like domain-containing protein [Enterocloster hominis (ex Hitch et al. 2024)]|uniref:Transglutaminase-like domain-containing protein n=1 Tax=Enterocloster hominis (ex Hitch et al. 2024) TaxID=1917870 RepID=A0ABV1DG14_9FIRM
MLKRNLLISMLGTALSMAMVFPSVAGSTWIIDPTPYEYTTGNEEWLKAEALAEIKVWVDARKDAILALPDDMSKYDAIVEQVCSFLEYDLKYTQAYISYTMRDGKGTCGDYATLTKALCDAVGIPCVQEFGIYLNDSHAWNKVTLNGVEYHSDLTSVDAGFPQYKLSATLWADHEWQSESSDIWSSISSSGRELSTNTDASIAAPAGTVACKSPSGQTFYVSQQDADDFAEGRISPQELMAKYGVQ